MQMLSSGRMAEFMYKWRNLYRFLQKRVRAEQATWGMKLGDLLYADMQMLVAVALKMQYIDLF
jgi:hypothetical protein